MNTNMQQKICTLGQLWIKMYILTWFSFVGSTFLDIHGCVLNDFIGTVNVYFIWAAHSLLCLAKISIVRVVPWKGHTDVCDMKWPIVLVFRSAQKNRTLGQYNIFILAFIMNSKINIWESYLAWVMFVKLRSVIGECNFKLNVH